MLLLVVVYERADGGVVAAGEHAGRGFFFGEGFGVDWGLVCVWGVRSNHLLILANPNTLPLHNLYIVQTRQNLMLHLELRSHVELGTLLDLERLVFESLLCILGREIDGDGWLTFGIHGEGEDDAVAGVIGVGEVLAAATETERLLVALHGFIVGVKLAIFIHGLLLSHLEPLSLLRQEILIIARGCHVCD